MFAIRRPIRAVYEAYDRTSVLYFQDDDPPPMKCMLRGGICWPMPVPRFQNQAQGFAVLLGYNIETQQLIVFEQREFVTVDHFTSPTPDPETGTEKIWQGACDYFGVCWQSYYASDHYYNHSEDTQRKWELRARRSKAVDPKPHFIRVQWDHPSDPEGVFSEKMTLGQLILPADSELDEALNTRQLAQANEKPEPPVHALYAALSGFDLYPYRPRKAPLRSTDWAKNIRPRMTER